MESVCRLHLEDTAVVASVSELLGTPVPLFPKIYPNALATPGHQDTEALSQSLDSELSRGQGYTAEMAPRGGA